MLPVVILAGGLATRLGPLSADTPKSMVKVAGEPFIFHQLRLLRRGGAERVKILVGHLGERIVEAVGDGAAFDLAVTYSADGPKLLGTGGALVRALPTLPAFFMVLYGDSYLEVDYREVARAFLYSGKLALMTVYKNENRHERSNAVFYNGAVRLYDKKNHDSSMNYVDYGLLCLSGEAFRDAPSGKFDLSETLAGLAVKKELAGLEVSERFYEIGSPTGLAELEKRLTEKI
ncbi:MAG: NTP transferase domain-containing protein [Deltaproteobacteria bacterium]|jgi:NDP-sugar pyrophosphorylase family protein|nr:NTP transferase domain-containing protein [Deltaproteobacteria bacterium]